MHLHSTPTPQNYVGNDDDPSCTSNGKASRLSTTFQVRMGIGMNWLYSSRVVACTTCCSTHARPPAELLLLLHPQSCLPT